MPLLHEIQTAFLTDISSDKVDNIGCFLTSEKFTPESAFQVYRNNFFISLTEALRAIYESVDKLVGEKFFNFVADTYIRKYPSLNGNLHEFGEQFPKFLRTQGSVKKLPYLSDIALLDWAWHSVFHSKDSSAFDFGSLAEVSPDVYAELIFIPASPVRFIASNYSIAEIWQSSRNERGDKQGVFRYDKGPEFMVLTRPDLEIGVYSMSEAEYRFLQCLSKGETLEQSLAVAQSLHESFEVSSVLQQNILRGVFTCIQM